MKKKLRKFLLSGLSGLLILNSSPLIPSVSASDICGDANNDGNVDLTDVTYISQYIRSQVNSINLKNADVDRNAVIDINDIKILQSYVMGGADLPNNATGIYYLPADNSRWYTKYNCTTGGTSLYYLSVNTTSNLSLDIDDRVIDGSDSATSIVRVEYTLQNGEIKYGTGFIVDDHIVATAAHCLCNPNTGEFHANIKIRPFEADGVTFGMAYPAKEAHVPCNYMTENESTTSNNRNVDHDYGLIYMEQDFSRYGKMPLGVSTINFNSKGATVGVSGYPSVVDGNSEGGVTRFVGYGNILSSSTNKLLHYDAYTSGGDSGGPIFLEYTLGDQTYRSAIGIHSNGADANHPYNYGPRVSKQLLRFYYNNSNIG